MATKKSTKGTKSADTMETVDSAEESFAAPKKAAKGTETAKLVIRAPDIRIVEFNIVGTAPFVSHRFYKKGEIMAKQQLGSQAGKNKTRKARDFEKDCEDSKHVSEEGWCGIPASAFRCAMISACRLVGFKMTIAKMSVFVVADGISRDDGLPLVRIYGEPEMNTAYVRNETGVVDIRARPMWREWSCKLRVSFDADQFSESDVANLLLRAGAQCGCGEGRPDSKKSAGMGWGTFTLTDG